MGREKNGGGRGLVVISSSLYSEYEKMWQPLIDEWWDAHVFSPYS